MCSRCDLVATRLHEEHAFLDNAIGSCDWRFSQLSVLEARRAVIDWVLDLIRDGDG